MKTYIFEDLMTGAQEAVEATDFEVAYQYACELLGYCVLQEVIFPKTCYVFASQETGECIAVYEDSRDKGRDKAEAQLSSKVDYICVLSLETARADGYEIY